MASNAGVAIGRASCGPDASAQTPRHYHPYPELTMQPISVPKRAAIECVAVVTVGVVFGIYVIRTCRPSR